MSLFKKDPTMQDVLKKLSQATDSTFKNKNLIIGLYSRILHSLYEPAETLLLFEIGQLTEKQAKKELKTNIQFLKDTIQQFEEYLKIDVK